MNRLDELSSLSPYLIIILFFLFYIYTKKNVYLYFVGFAIIFGLLFNIIEKKIFSKIFNGDYFIYRPNPYNKNGELNDYKSCGILPDQKVSNIGFPSGHAQFWGFVIAFWTLYLLKSKPKNYREYILILWVMALYVLYSRVKIGCHTDLQVITGFFIGIFLGYLVYNYLK